MDIKANTCPYCGGPYTIDNACTGPRTANLTENRCEGMLRHEALIREALEDEEECEESGRWDLDAPSVIPEADFREWPCPLGGACTDPTCHAIKRRQNGEDIGGFALRVGLLDVPGGSHA